MLTITARVRVRCSSDEGKVLLQIQKEIDITNTDDLLDMTDFLPGRRILRWLPSRITTSAPARSAVSGACLLPSLYAPALAMSTFFVPRVTGESYLPSDVNSFQRLLTYCA